MTNKIKWSDLGGNFMFLSSDGACLIFVIVDAPVMLESKYQGKPQKRIGVPVMTLDGFALFITGMRVARKLSRFEDRFADSAFMVTRHGTEGDKDSTYDVALIEDEEKVQSLFALAKKDYTPKVLAEAVKEAQEIMKG